MRLQLSPTSHLYIDAFERQARGTPIVKAARLSTGEGVCRLGDWLGDTNHWWREVERLEVDGRFVTLHPRAFRHSMQFGKLKRLELTDLADAEIDFWLDIASRAEFPVLESLIVGVHGRPASVAGLLRLPVFSALTFLDLKNCAVDVLNLDVRISFPNLVSVILGLPIERTTITTDHSLSLSAPLETIEVDFHSLQVDSTMMSNLQIQFPAALVDLTLRIAMITDFDW